MTLARGAHFPHIVLTRLDGGTCAYLDLWQRRNLLLVCLGEAAGRADLDLWIAALAAQAPAFDAYKTAVVVTRDAVAGLEAPAVIVVDRWGEIVSVEPWDATAALPDVSDLVEWTRFVAQACPECEAEAK